MKKNQELWVHLKQPLKKLIVKLSIALIIIVLTVPNIFADSSGTEPQQKQITGVVVDKNGPIVGANVVITGTTTGTITDIDGKYSIAVPQGAQSLTFTFIGMEPQEITIGALTKIDVTMTETAIGLDEVVVIGYGTTRKVDLTGSVSSIKGDDLARNKSSIKITNALQGTMPGVTVSRSGNEPGSVGSIKIRGVTTIGNSDPLVIIDGIPGSLSSLKADDVESISVLKDAASASIYGSKAASGVIVITTKRAKKGELSLQYDVQYAFDQPTRLPNHVSSQRYMEMINEMVWNDAGNVGTEYPTYAKDLIDNYPALHASNPDQYPDESVTNYMKDWTPRQTHSMSFTAGQNNILSRGSVAYDKQEAIIGDRPYQQIVARINNDVIVNKFVTAHLDIQYLNSYDQTKQGGIGVNLFFAEPMSAYYWSDGRVAQYRNAENNVARVIDGGDDKRWSDEVSGRIALDITPLEGLKISGVVAPKYTYYKRKDHFLSVPMTEWNEPNVITGYVNGVKYTNLTEYRNDSKSFTTQLLTNYSKKFGDHNLDLLAGYENYYSFAENLSAGRDQYILNNFPYLNLGPLDYRTNSGDAWEYASRSFFGRAIYGYKNKYILQANARYDGSSRFAEENRYGLFPSFSAGWVISEESFLKDAVPALSFLKLRASWGKLGNERIGNYPYQATVAFENVLFYSGSSVITSQAAYLPRYVIKDITWETTETYDIGLDVNLFENKLQISGDYYKKTTKDMLLALEIPDYIGLENPDQNTGEMYTNGWELDVRYNNNIGDLYYTVSANLSDFVSKMGDLGGTEFLGQQVKFEGSEFNEWYGYKAIGLYQTQEEIDNSAVKNNRVRPGDVQYEDISGPNGVPDGIISAEYDRTLLGGSLPRYEYGASIQLKYKDFDFGLIFQGIGRVYKYYNQTMVGGHQVAPRELGFWSHYNTDEENQKAYYPRLSAVAGGGNTPQDANNYIYSDYWLVNARYLRLKNITLGYNVPKMVTNRLGIQNLRVYVSGSDLFSIDNYMKEFDPENTYGAYFITRSVLFGATLNF